MTKFKAGDEVVVIHEDYYGSEFRLISSSDIFELEAELLYTNGHDNIIEKVIGCPRFYYRIYDSSCLMLKSEFIVREEIKEVIEGD